MSISAVLGLKNPAVFSLIKQKQAALQTTLREWETTCKIIALKVASRLTDPICKIREYFYTFYILDKICDTTAQKVQKIAQLTLSMIGCMLLAPFTAPLGAAIRRLVERMQSKPYIYLGEGKVGKVLPTDKKITLASHNQCYMPAGYSITDGQVTPPSDKARLDANIDKLKALDPDIICLYEVADICDAAYISSKLPDYPFLIPVAGIRAVGPSSMMYIASKYEIVENSIQFVPFEKGTELTGRAQFSEKGFLSFDIKSRGEKKGFAHLVSTHLQHSEIPERPEAIEVVSRSAQMKKIADHIKKKVAEGENIIFTGDLNQEEKEIEAFFSKHKMDWLKRDPAVKGQVTWGGDPWCAKLMKKIASNPLVLDYTFVAGKVRSIATQIFGTGYCGTEFKKEATSDHDLLYSTVMLG